LIANLDTTTHILSHREMEFREEQEAFPSATWERGEMDVA
jgi:hypothetical protein